MYPLGSGSDFTAFLQHCGVSSAYASFRNNNSDYEAVYHSNYDSIYWFSHFVDTEFKYHQAMVEVRFISFFFFLKINFY